MTLPDLSHLFRRTGIDLVFHPDSDIPPKLIEELERIMLTNGLRVSDAILKQGYAPQQLINDVRAYVGLEQERKQKITTACMNIADELIRGY
jgi:hypothetical protein